MVHQKGFTADQLTRQRHKGNQISPLPVETPPPPPDIKLEKKRRARKDTKHENVIQAKRPTRPCPSPYDDDVRGPCLGDDYLHTIAEGDERDPFWSDDYLDSVIAEEYACADYVRRMVCSILQSARQHSAPRRQLPPREPIRMQLPADIGTLAADLLAPPPPGVEIRLPAATHPRYSCPPLPPGLVKAPTEPAEESTKPAEEPTEPTELPPRSTQPICPLDGPYSHDIYEVFSDDGDPWQNGEPVRIQVHHGEPVRIQLRHGEPVRVLEPADIGTKARDLPVIRIHGTFWL